jgi:hypothetical protein
MTELLQRALAAIEKLPADVQEAIATCLLAEADDEQAWAARFASPLPRPLGSHLSLSV